VDVCNWGCCFKEDSVTVFVNQGPSGTVSPDVTISTGQSTLLTATPTQPGPFDVYDWYPTTGLVVPDENYSGNVSVTAIASPTVTTTYYVTFIDTNTSCTITDSVTVFIFNCQIYVPDAFDPDNPDGLNTVFYVRSECVKTLDFAVYDRWGNRVFYTNDINIGWDGRYEGKAMNMGVFSYYVTALLYNNQLVVKKGNVTLLR